MSTYMIRNQSGKLINWTGLSTEAAVILAFASVRGECWEKLSGDDGYEVVEVVAHNPALLTSLLDIEALADREKHGRDGVQVDVEALLPDILYLARAAIATVKEEI